MFPERGVVRVTLAISTSGLRKFYHSKLSVYRWYPQLDPGLFVYDTYKTMEATRPRHGWVHMFITHRPTVTLQLHNFYLFRTCHRSSVCTVAWQLARFQLTRCIARSLGDSGVSCFLTPERIKTKMKLASLDTKLTTGHNNFQTTCCY